MIKKLNNFISKYRYRLKKISVKLERPEIKNLTSVQEKVIKIVTDILIDSETKLHINPIDHKLYLKKFEDKKMHIFIIISKAERHYNINITGKNFIKSPKMVENSSENNIVVEKFHYDIEIPINSGRIIVNKFNKKLKRIVTKMETDIIKENEDNLSDLIISLKKNN